MSCFFFEYSCKIVGIRKSALGGNFCDVHIGILSLYDVNPVPYGEDLALNVSEDDSAISFDLAIETAQYYGITQKEAEKIVEVISKTVLT